MLRLIAQRFIAGLVVLFFASVLVFMLSRASGDPRHLFLTEYTSQDQWEAWGREFGLDKPYPVQYLIWASGVLRMDFGDSVKEQVPATVVVSRKVWPTVQLGLSAFTFGVVVGVPLGVFSAVSRGKAWDLVGRAFALVGQAMPGFWLGIMLILVFAVRIEWFPVGGRDHGFASLVLPSITLGWFAAAALLRLTRSSMLEALDSEYIKLARAKGVSRQRIIWKHAFRNAIIGPLTYAGVFFTAILTGAVVTETVFAWPGLGRLAIQSVFGTDFPVISVIVLLTTAGYLLMNLTIDILYGVLDPRMRHGHSQ